MLTTTEFYLGYVTIELGIQQVVGEFLSFVP